MPTADYTTTGFLASVKRRVMLATQSETFSDADILAIATEELQSYVFPFLISVREEYAVTTTDIAYTSATAFYDLPEFAVGDKARDVLLLRDGKYWQLDRIEPERIQDHAATANVPYGFSFQGSKIQLIPAPTTNGTIRIKYFHRPGWLVPLSQTSILSNISGNNVTPNNYIFNNGNRVSIVSGKAPYYVIASGTVLFLNIPDIDLSFDAQAAGAEDGDYLCFVGESPIPQVPTELHPLLVARTVYAMYVAQGDGRAQEALQNCELLKKNLLTVLTPRSEGNARYIINRHGPGWRNPSWRNNA